MRAQLRRILPCNRSLAWDEFVPYSGTRRPDGHGRFTLDIGPEGELGSEIFDVDVSTAAAASRARNRGEREFRGFIVESFDAETITQTLRSYVSSVTGSDWRAIVEQLRHRMDWEYEGMSPDRPGKPR